MSDKINIIINQDNLPKLIDKLSDLTKISDIVKFKIDSENILIYSLVGESAIVAFKSFLLKTSDYFITEDITEGVTLDYVVLSAKRFVKNLSFFNCDNPIKMSLTFRDSPNESIKYVRNMSASDGRFKINIIGAEPYKVRDIDKFKLKTLLNKDNSEWSLQIKENDFEDVKKLSSINSESKIITISTVKGNIHFGEIGKWDLNIGETNESKGDITFPKKYLSCINNSSDTINFTIFETFLLFQEEDTNFMVSFEFDYENDDDDE